MNAPAEAFRCQALAKEIAAELRAKYVMTQRIGAHLTNDEKRAHLIGIKREHLIDQVCIQEILPPDKT